MIGVITTDSFNDTIAADTIDHSQVVPSVLAFHRPHANLTVSTEAETERLSVTARGLLNITRSLVRTCIAVSFRASDLHRGTVNTSFDDVSTKACLTAKMS
jgi:hypothetical protein